MPQKKSTSTSGRATIRQVAEKAGVTIGTVSHVMNGTASISPETTLRVRAAIDELHYIPNLTAKSLRSKNGRLIGLLIPNLNNPFYSKTASVLIDLAFENGYTAQIFGYEYSLEKELQAIDSLCSSSVDTVVIFNGCEDEDGIRRLLSAHKKVILADRTSDMENVCCVSFDNHQAIFDAVSLLKSKGLRRIGFLSEPLSLTNVNKRFFSYRQALDFFGLPFEEENVVICSDFRLNATINGYHFIKDRLNHSTFPMPDAFIATSDLLAIGAIRAFAEGGVSVPADVGMISFDNLDISSFVSPPLTTIEQSQSALGEALFDMVRLSWEGTPFKRYRVLSQKLIVRASC